MKNKRFGEECNVIREVSVLNNQKDFVFILFILLFLFLLCLVYSFTYHFDQLSFFASGELVVALC